jgi:hypothetical protein
MTRMPFAATAVVLGMHSLECNAQVPELCKPTLAPRASGEQVADRRFSPPVVRPAFAPGTGPKVLFDEAHLNIHTAVGRYAPFVDLLRRDGFIVEPNRSQFSGESLASTKILVIVNALAPRNKRSGWTLPARSAFSKREIDAVRDWVWEGGSLLLIADHMPFPGVAADLAREFGVFMVDGFATDRTCGEDGRRNSRAAPDARDRRPASQARRAVLGGHAPHSGRWDGSRGRVVLWPGARCGIRRGGNVLCTSIREAAATHGNEHAHCGAEPTVPAQRDALAFEDSPGELEWRDLRGDDR